MANKLTRDQIGQGVYFSSVQDQKFKHNQLTVSFILPLDAATASDNAVVPFVLRKGTRECPDFTALNARLAELYGAVLDADVGKYGGLQAMEVSIKGLDNRFALEGEDITGQCAALLAAVALDPCLDEAGLLRAGDIALERQYVLDCIDAEINNKRTYAYSRCVQTMCAGEPVAVRRYGDRATAEAVTPESATAAYRRMANEARIEILFTGSGDPAPAKAVFAQRFAGVQRSPVETAQPALRTEAATVREETETMEVSQSKLVLGMRTGKVEGERGRNARRVFSAMYGGTPFSKLFLNVREKLSLCYYCASRFDSFTGLLLVDSGVETANRQKAQDEILAQLKAVQDGAFDAEELANTKLLMKNSVTSSGDSLGGLEGWYLSQIMQGTDRSPEEDAAQIDEITRQEVIDAANAVSLDTIYFLTGAGEGAQ